jgi:hypothetical protein
MSSPERLRGGCLCGAVGYEVEDAFQYALNCHCSRCRRATGAAFKPFGGIEREKLRLVRGEDRLLIFGEPDGSHDLRCSGCGSLLWSIVREGKWAHVTYGTLLDPPSLKVQAHIMVGSKAPWFTITDDLPQHEEF